MKCKNNLVYVFFFWVSIIYNECDRLSRATLSHFSGDTSHDTPGPVTWQVPSVLTPDPVHALMLGMEWSDPWSTWRENQNGARERIPLTSHHSRFQDRTLQRREIARMLSVSELVSADIPHMGRHTIMCRGWQVECVKASPVYEWWELRSFEHLFSNWCRV